MDKKKIWQTVGFWVALTICFAVIAGISVSFALNQMGKRIDAESRSFMAESNLNKNQIKLYVLAEKYKTCMEAARFHGGSN